MDSDLNKMRNRAMARRLQVQENIVRNRLEYGGPLTAEEISRGVRLSHEEFLHLVRLAMSALNKELAEDK